MAGLTSQQKSFRFLSILAILGAGFFEYFVFPADSNYLVQNNRQGPISPPKVLKGVFVRDVFRSKDNEVQMFFLRDYQNQVTVELKLNDTWVPFHSHCYYSICRGTFDHCTYMDYFGQVPIPANFSEEVAVVRLQGSKREHSFKILDVRPNGLYKYELGAVLQPAYYMADWQNLIQFFESWIAHGATKFYIYHYSWTKQVQKVVDFYQNHLPPSAVEVLPWSAVPIELNEEGQFDSDPNTRMFNLASESALNNALYRSKKDVKFLALMDLDEIVSVTNGEPLLSLLNKWDIANENTAQFTFHWLQYSTRVNLVSLDKPIDVTFNYLESIYSLSNKSMEPGYFNGKAIHRSDREVSVNSSEATVIHLRRVFDSHRPLEVTSEKEDLLNEISWKMTAGFKRRIRESSFSDYQMSPWVAQYESVLLTLHDCRRVTQAGFPITVDAGLTLCRSIRGCEQFLKGKEFFIFAQMSWTDLSEPLDVLTPVFDELLQKEKTNKKLDN